MTAEIPSSLGAVVVPVGPDPHEVERLGDLACAIAAHEPEAGVLVIVDDAPEPRDLASGLALPPTMAVVSLHHTRPTRRHFSRGKGICSVVLQGMKWVQAHTRAPFAVKLDTDSLVIGPYRQRLVASFQRNPKLGMVGAHRTTPRGQARDFFTHGDSLRAITRRFDWRHPRASLREWRDPLKARVRGLLGAAQANGYEPGEHCLGGGYAVSRRLLDEMAAAGHLDDPSLWLQADLPEDVTVGLHVGAHGLAFADAVDEGEVFGVRYIGLAFPPAELLARRHAIIHAVKNDPDLSEDEIRTFFRAHRAAAPTPRS